MTRIGIDLSMLAKQAVCLQQVRKADLQAGDCVIVKTRNSVYQIRATEDGEYIVSGGWFDHKGLSPVKINVAGCTWGGTAIKLDVVAACGLCLEFGNRVVTSAIQAVAVLRCGFEN
jgi:hypothetical protein